MPPYISSRAFIQWLPSGVKAEPTSTLVLTSSQRRFVDIRILQPERQNNSPSTPTTVAEAEHAQKPITSNPTSPDLSSIDWAFAGTSVSTTNPLSKETHSQWHHWVDSQTLNPEDVVDKGEMLPEDPDSGLSLEKGQMVNPATGRLAEYVEGWRDVEPLYVPSVYEREADAFLGELEGKGVRVGGLRERVSCLEGDRTGENAGAGKLSLVMRYEDSTREARGLVVRVGHVCEGVLRVGGEFGLERWVWKDEDGESGWRREFAVGALDMPCDVLNVLGEMVGLGTEVRYGKGGGAIWTCEEAERF